MRTRDYRTYMRSVNRKSINLASLRTVKHPGDVEIVYRNGEYQMHRYGEGEAA